MNKTITRFVAGSAALGVLGGGMLLVSDLYKEPTLVVDGTQTRVAGFFGNVGDVLASEGIDVGRHDAVAPGLDAPVQDGDLISVRYGRELQLVIDGKVKTYWTTDTTLGTALENLGIDLNRVALSEEPTRSLGREGLKVTITTPKPISVTADGMTRTIETVEPTVGDALTALGIKVSADDKVTPAVSSPITAGLKITVARVSVQQITRTEPIAFTKTTKQDPTLEKGTTKVQTKGVNGERTIVEKIIKANGKITKEQVSSTVTILPIDEVTLVGTKTGPADASAGKSNNPSGKGTGAGSATNPNQPPGPGNGSDAPPADPSESAVQGPTDKPSLNLEREEMWDRIAKCESGGNWSLNTGNGHYGGLQFKLRTWRSVNGHDFAEYPHQASREEQITVANRLYEKQGTQPWSCA